MTSSAEPNRFRNLALGTVAGLAAAMIWGGGAVVSRHLVGSGLAPVDLAVLRYLGCFLVAAALLIARPGLRRDRLPAGRLAIVLLLAGPPYQILLLAGYGHATAGGGSLLVSGLLPVFALVLAGLSGQAVPALSRLGAGLALAGLTIFALGSPLNPSTTALGALVFASAAALWAAFNFLVARWNIDPLQLTLALALWSPVFLPLWWLAPSSRLLPSLPDAVLQIAYHGVLVAFLATWAFFLAVRRLGAGAAGVLQAATPLCAAALGALLLGETLAEAQLVGAAMTVAGIGLAVSGSWLIRRTDSPARGDGRCRFART